jgi:hypothetical protein
MCVCRCSPSALNHLEALLELQRPIEKLDFALPNFMKALVPVFVGGSDYDGYIQSAGPREAGCVKLLGKEQSLKSR